MMHEVTMRAWRHGMHDASMASLAKEGTSQYSIESCDVTLKRMFGGKRISHSWEYLGAEQLRYYLELGSLES